MKLRTRQQRQQARFAFFVVGLGTLYLVYVLFTSPSLQTKEVKAMHDRDRSDGMHVPSTHSSGAGHTRISDTGGHGAGARPGQPREPSLLEDARLLRDIAAAYAQPVRPEMFNVSSGGIPYSDALLDTRSACWMHPETGEPRCLPFLWFIGVFQTGMRDLWERAKMHPEILVPSDAKPHFLIEARAWESYIAAYDRVSEDVASASLAVAAEVQSGSFALPWAHTVDVLHKAFLTNAQECWRSCKDPEKCERQACFPVAQETERTFAREAGAPIDNGGEGFMSTFTTPWLLRAMLGGHPTRGRLVFLLRNPIDRLYAAFQVYPHYADFYGGKTPAAFSSYLDDQLPHLYDCYAKYGRRQCVLAFEALQYSYERVFYHADQILKSEYGVFLDMWLEAFPLEHVLLLQSEAYFDDPKSALQRVFAHAGLSPLAEEEMSAAVAKPVTRLGQREPASLAPMKASDRERLSEFYRPCVDAVVQLTGDDSLVRGWLSSE